MEDFKVFKMKKMGQILAGLVAVFLLPLAFVVTYVMGLDSGSTSQGLGVSYGIVAYVWLLMTIYVGTGPAWLKRVVSLDVAKGFSQFLSLVALSFAGFHKELSPALGLVEQTGDLALMVLVSAGLYWAVFGSGLLDQRVPVLANLKQMTSFSGRLSAWIQGLMVIGSALVFVHGLLIASLWSNLVFMTLFVVISLFVFGSYALQQLTAPAQETAQEVIVASQAERQV